MRVWRNEANQALFDKRRERAGFYALVSSRKNADPLEIYADLRRLWHIEECFRVMKTNLDARPVFVWTPKRIRGHFLVCYLALVLERLGYWLVRKNGLGLSNQQVIELLNRARVGILEQDKTKKTLYLRQGISANEQKNERFTESVDQLLSVVGIDLLATIEDSLGLARKLKAKSNVKLIS